MTVLSPQFWWDIRDAALYRLDEETIHTFLRASQDLLFQMSSHCISLLNHLRINEVLSPRFW